MCDPFAIYEEQVEAITEACVDPWFGAQFAAYRAGDETAWRAISGRCLRLVLRIAKRTWKPGTRLSALDLVQEGNWELVRTIRGFPGGTAEKFLREVNERVAQRLTLLIQHPDLAK